jgi:hypothetical protein
VAVVPPAWGGAAGGALQTGQRIGSSIGAAVLVTVFNLGVGGTPDTAFRAALLTGVVFLLAALVMAVRAARQSPDPA